MSWNKKNQQFALSCGLRNSSLQLLQCLLRRANPNKVVEIEIDLRVLNKWIGKYRPQGEYDRKTIKSALWQLDEKTQGMILVTKSYTWAIHKVMVRPLNIVLEQNSQTGKSAPSLNRGNPMFSEEHKKRVLLQQQQDTSKINSLLLSVGLKYDSNALTRIWRLAGKKIEPVMKAIELMLYRHSSSEIAKPHGFIIQCLTEGWQKSFDIYYEPELPKFELKSQIANFVDGLLDGDRLRHQT